MEEEEPGKPAGDNLKATLSELLVYFWYSNLLFWATWLFRAALRASGLPTLRETCPHLGQEVEVVVVDLRLRETVSYCQYLW